MKDVILEVFAEVVELLVQENYIKLENYFWDDTKTEAMPINIVGSGAKLPNATKKH